MKALVTGATGFIGGSVARRLLDEGWSVRVLARNAEKAKALTSAGAEIVPGDVERTETLPQAVAGVEAVFHAAASVDLIKPRRADILRTNVEGTRNVLEAALSENVDRVVHLSSVAAIGRRGEAADETIWHDGDYQSVYEESKHLAEGVALEYGRKGLDVVHVLPCVVTGPGDPKTGSFIKRYIRRKVPAVPNVDGSTSFVDIHDLTDGILLAHKKGKPNERYIFAQATWTTSQLLRELELATGIPPPRRIPVGIIRSLAALEEARAFLLRRPPLVSRAAVRLATMKFGYSSAKARRELGWSPRDFRERFHATVHYWMKEVEKRAAAR